MRKIAIVFLLVFIFGCDSPNSKNGKQTDIQRNQAKVNYRDIEGNEVDLLAFKGRKILLNYWATWCQPCIKEMPALLKAQEILKEHNYTFLLASDESISEISDFKKKKNYDFIFLKSTGSSERLGIYMLPTTYVFNEDGKKVETIVGSVIWDSKEMIDKLKGL